MVYEIRTALAARRDLVRACGGLDDRNQRQNEFYGSAAWKLGPREKIVAAIASSHSVVIDRLPA